MGIGASAARASAAAAASERAVTPANDPPVVLVHLESSSELDEGNESGQLVLLLGADGSFSPADGASLAEAFGGTYIQYNQIMRDAIIAGTPAGAEITKALKSGGAVPARLILEFLAPKVASTPPPHLLDGFPRSMDHLTLLESEVQRCTWAIHFAPSNDEIVSNLLGRGLDQAAAEKRLDLHYSQTMPVVRVLNVRGILTTVSGSNALQQAEAALRGPLGHRKPQMTSPMPLPPAPKGILTRSTQPACGPHALTLDDRPPPPVPLTPLAGSGSCASAGRPHASVKKHGSPGPRVMPGSSSSRGIPPSLGSRSMPGSSGDLLPPPIALPALIPLPPMTPIGLAAVTSFQAHVRSALTRKQLRKERIAAVKWQALVRGGMVRRRLERMRLPKVEGLDKAIVIRAIHVDESYGEDDLRAAPPFEADLSGITRVAKNNLGLFEQPSEPSFRVGMVQIYVRKARFGGPDKSSNGHRFDMVPLANGMILAGMSCHPFHYLHEEHESFLDMCRRFDALLLRFGTADIEDDGGKRARFLGGMRQLQQDEGIMVWPWPAEGGGLPAQLLTAFDEPGAPKKPHQLSKGTGSNTVAEAAWLGPPFSQCEAAVCTAEQPQACWIDVGEHNMTSAIACASRVAQAMLKLLEEDQRKQKKLG